MLDKTSALLVATLAGAALVGVTPDARGGERHGNCCGPIPPTQTSSTVEKVSHVTRYHDEWKKNYVDRTKLYLHVTRVQPVVYVHNVLRVHYVTVPVIRPVHVSRVEYLPPQQVETSSVVHINEGCVCAPAASVGCR